MFTLTVDYFTHESVTEQHQTLDDAIQSYSDADFMACHAPSDISAGVKRITLRTPDGATIKTRAYPRG